MKIFITGGSGFVGQNLIPLLISRGNRVVALARSKTAQKTIEQLGALAIEGDLNAIFVLKNNIADCETVFHLAANVDFYASEEELFALHVTATLKLLEIAKTAGVKNFVYLSAASVIMNGKPISNADESFISENLIDGYSRTKLAAEQLVLKANSTNFKTIAIRAPLIWGKGDMHVLPSIIQAIQQNKMQFIGGGMHRISTCHVRNVCEALILADQANKGGEAYFVTDAESVVFKDFITQYVATQGVKVPNKTVSLGTAKIIATIMEFAWKTFKIKRQPSLYRAMVNILGLEFTVNDNKAKKELGYRPFVSFKQGLIEM